MRKVLMLVMLGLMSIPAAAQVRFVAGPEGGYEFGNTFGGVTGGIEVPAGQRFEIDLLGSYDPIESHVKLGHGLAYTVVPRADVWLTNRVGLTGSFTDSGYMVTNLKKNSFYTSGGLIVRGRLGGAPTRFYIEYIRQLANGIDKSGTETDHIQGGRFIYEARLGCKGPVCFRLKQSFDVGHVLTQGNPACDGTFKLAVGVAPCQRLGALSGGVTNTLLIEKRPKGSESDLF